MSSNQLLLELLQFSQSISSLQNLQLLSLQQSNSLFSFSPQVLDFSQQCDNSFNSLSNFVSSPLNSLLLNLNNGQSACLEQLIQLEQLFLSGSSNIDLNNSNSNNGLNSTDVSNSTASVDVNNSNSTAAAGSANVSANAAPSTENQPSSKSAKGDAKKEGKRAEVVQRSAAGKMKVLGSLGLGGLLLAGALAM